MGPPGIVAVAAAGTLPAKVVDDRVAAGGRDEPGDVAVAVAAQHQVALLRSDASGRAPWWPPGPRDPPATAFRACGPGSGRSGRAPRRAGATVPPGREPGSRHRAVRQVAGRAEPVVLPRVGGCSSWRGGDPVPVFRRLWFRCVIRHEGSHTGPDEGGCVRRIRQAIHRENIVMTNRDGSLRTRPGVGSNLACWMMGDKPRRVRVSPRTPRPFPGPEPAPDSLSHPRGGAISPPVLMQLRTWGGNLTSKFYRVTTIRRVSAAAVAAARPGPGAARSTARRRPGGPRRRGRSTRRHGRPPGARPRRRSASGPAGPLTS